MRRRADFFEHEHLGPRAVLALSPAVALADDLSWASRSVSRPLGSHHQTPRSLSSRWDRARGSLSLVAADVGLAISAGVAFSGSFIHMKLADLRARLGSLLTSSSAARTPASGAGDCSRAGLAASSRARARAVFANFALPRDVACSS